MADRNAVKVIDRPEASALGEIVASELSKQIATAKQYPRDESAALDMLLALATRSDATAELCMYSLKRTDRNGKAVFITGPSIRFAELLVYCWGNIRAGARIVEEADKHIIAQGVAYDLQRNTGLMTTVRRGITTNNGGRFSADMINVTSNAACSIAERNAIIDCIPQILWQDVFDRVKDKAIGAAQIPERIQKAVAFFVAKGAIEKDILTALGAKSINDMGREHLEIFIGLTTALRDGSIAADKIFTAEGAEQRAKLNLYGDDQGDPAHPDGRGTPIDVVLNKGQAALPPAEQNGGQSKPAAAEAKGDGLPEQPDADQTKAAGAGGGSAPAAPAESAPGGEDAEAEDRALLAEIEAKLDPAKMLSSRKAVNASRGALARIAEMGSEDLKARAATILQNWPAK